jgi:hypothetical protein
MRTLSTTELLGIWERGAVRSPVQRALLLLEAACPEQSRESLSSVAVGERDARLLALRERMFGAIFHGTATCPRCCDLLELSFSADDIRSAAASRLPAESGVTTHRVQVNEYDLQFRLPDSRDLEAIALVSDIFAARRMLFERCVVNIRQDRADCGEQDVPDEVVQRVEQRMAELDPQGDVELSLTCPHCSHQWPAGFDIGSFLWDELHVWALRTLEDVHVLASAYGWHEADILTLSPWRRQAYLELVGQ